MFTWMLTPWNPVRKANWWQTWGTADASTDPCQVKAQQWHCRLHGLCRRSFRKGRMGLGGVLWCATVRVRRQTGRNSWLGNSSLQLRKSGSSSIFAWCLALRLCPEFRVVLLCTVLVYLCLTQGLTRWNETQMTRCSPSLDRSVSHWWNARGCCGGDNLQEFWQRGRRRCHYGWKGRRSREREREDSSIWGKYKLDIVTHKTHKCSWLGLPWTSKSTKESSWLCRAKSTRMASLCFGVFVLRCVADTLVYCFLRKSPPISSGLLIRNQVHGFWWSVSMSG